MVIVSTFLHFLNLAPFKFRYVGPTGRSETPDSYNLSRHGHSINKEVSFIYISYDFHQLESFI